MGQKYRCKIYIYKIHNTINLQKDKLPFGSDKGQRNAEIHKREEERTTAERGLTIILQFHILAEPDNGATLSATHCWDCQETKAGGQSITLLQLRFAFQGQM